MKILLVIYDNESYIHEFPLGAAYIAAALRDANYDVEIYNQDVFHYSDEHLTEYLNNNHFDAIACGVIGGYYQYRKIIKISEAIRNSNQELFYILGGHGPSSDPEFYLRKTQADAVIIGEGEVTIVDLLNSHFNNKDLNQVEGITYKKDEEFITTEERELIQDIDSITFPAYDLFPIEYYNLMKYPNSTGTDFTMPMLSGRGCKFKCNFCYRMDKGHRLRSHESIIKEVKMLKENYGITYIIFSDELLMSSVKRTEEFCNDIINADLNIKWWCNGRLNYAKRELLELMKKAGCVFINYGIESMDDESLRKMNKALTVKQIISGVEATLDVGISPGLNIIWGNIDEDKQTLQNGVDFLLKYGDGSQMRTIRPVTPYPGSPLYSYAIQKGLLKDCEDFYENKHLNSDLVSVNFTKLSDDEFHAALYEANTTLIKDYFNKKLMENLDGAKKLYFENDVTFRGFRPV